MMTILKPNSKEITQSSDHSNSDSSKVKTEDRGKKFFFKKKFWNNSVLGKIGFFAVDGNFFPKHGRF